MSRESINGFFEASLQYCATWRSGMSEGSLASWEESEQDIFSSLITSKTLLKMSLIHDHNAFNNFVFLRGFCQRLKKNETGSVDQTDVHTCIA